MGKSNHSKFRNTGIIFELLVRQITSDILSNKESKSLIIMNEFFRPGTELSKELELYQTLIKDKFYDKDKSERFIDAVLDTRKRLNTSELRKQRYNLVKAIKEHYSLDEFLKYKINEYKILASINQLFEHCIGNVIKPVDVVNSKCTLIEHVSKQKVNVDVVKAQLVEDEYRKQDQDIRLLAYKICIDKFNSKYSPILSDKQKTLLREYVNSVDNTNTLREYVNTEIPKVKKEIKKYISCISDQATQIKLTEVSNQMDNFMKGNAVSDDHILILMRYYSLITELKELS